MSITSGLTPLISYLNTTDEGKPKELKDYDQNFKDYIFDYEDPYEYATLPLYAAGPAGMYANRAIKAKRIADKAYKPSGIQSILSKPGVNVGIPSATLAGDVTYDLATDEEFMGDIKTIANIEDDALDEANKDLKDVNEKEEEEKEKSKLSKLGEALSGLAALGEPGQMSSGYMIEGSGIATPEIRRYEAGGIASLEPEMMADGGIAKFAGGSGRAGIFTRTAKTLSKKAADRKQKKADKAQDKADKAKAKADEAEAKAKKAEAEVKETGVTKDKPEGPGFLDFVSPTYASGITATAKKASDLASAAGRNIKPIAGAATAYGLPLGIAGGIGYAALKGDETSKTTKKSTDATVPEIEESDAMKDILYQNSLERATSAGRTEPSFVDYLASFPGSYTEKVGKDPEFAKQMMAGFMAMMKPTEGYVPRNALVDFGEAAMAEGVRQEGALSDQEKLLQMSDEDISRLQDIQAGAQRLTKESILASGLLLAQFREQLTGDKDGEVYDTNNLNIPLNNISMLALMKELNDDPIELSKRIIRKP